MIRFLIAVAAVATLFLHFVFIYLADFFYAPGVTCQDPCTFHWHWSLSVLFLPEVIATVGLATLLALPFAVSHERAQRALSALCAALLALIVVAAIASGILVIAHPHYLDALART